MDNLIKIIKDLIRRKFYGTLTIQFRAGQIALIRKEETIRLPE
jgi:hypothetical protein